MSNFPRSPHLHLYVSNAISVFRRRSLRQHQRPRFHVAGRGGSMDNVVCRKYIFAAGHGFAHLSHICKKNEVGTVNMDHRSAEDLAIGCC